MNTTLAYVKVNIMRRYTSLHVQNLSKNSKFKKIIIILRLKNQKIPSTKMSESNAEHDVKSFKM